MSCLVMQDNAVINSTAKETSKPQSDQPLVHEQKSMTVYHMLPVFDIALI